MRNMTDKWHMFEGDLYDTTKPDWSSNPVRKDYAKHFREITSVLQLKSTLRAGEYAWPGGYQLAFITSDGCLLCFGCVAEEFRNVCHSIKTDCSDGWKVVALTVLYEAPEGDEMCGHCSRVLLEQNM